MWWYYIKRDIPWMIWGVCAWAILIFLYAHP